MTTTLTAEILVRVDGEVSRAYYGNARNPRLAGMARGYNEQDGVSLVGIRIGGASEVYTPEQVEAFQAAEAQA